MRNKLFVIVFVFAIFITMFCAQSFAAAANPTASTVLVDGGGVAFDAYNINDNNYFKLRDLAYTLSGSAKQFDVGWDEAANAISLTSGQAYTVAGGEMSGMGGGAQQAAPTDSKILKDGDEVQFTAYNIGGNNYFKLRDIGEAFNFGVDWDEALNTIVIDTGKGYAAGGGTAPVSTGPVAGGGPASAGPGTGTEIKNNYSKSELAKIKTDFEAIVQKEPSGGKEISSSELFKMQEAYKKILIDGNSYHNKYIYGQFEEDGGKWKITSMCDLIEDWNMDSSFRSDRLSVVDEYLPENEGVVSCYLSLDDADYYYYYDWYKGATTGEVRNSAKEKSRDYYPGGETSDTKVMLYDDAVVDGQECIVYRYQYEDSYTYYWFSKSKGYDILSQSFVTYNDMDPWLYVNFYYIDEYINMDKSFFNPDNQGVSVWREE